MTSTSQRYRAGFLRKCAEHGVNPEVLIKRAKMLPNEIPGYNTTGFNSPTNRLSSTALYKRTPNFGNWTPSPSVFGHGYGINSMMPWTNDTFAGNPGYTLPGPRRNSTNTPSWLSGSQNPTQPSSPGITGLQGMGPDMREWIDKLRTGKLPQQTPKPNQAPVQRPIQQSQQPAQQPQQPVQQPQQPAQRQLTPLQEDARLHNAKVDLEIDQQQRENRRRAEEQARLDQEWRAKHQTAEQEFGPYWKGEMAVLHGEDGKTYTQDGKELPPDPNEEAEVAEVVSQPDQTGQPEEQQLDPSDPDAEFKQTLSKIQNPERRARMIQRHEEHKKRMAERQQSMDQTSAETEAIREAQRQQNEQQNTVYDPSNPPSSDDPRQAAINDSVAQLLNTR